MSDITFSPHVPLVIILLVFIISMLFAYIGFRVRAKGYILRTLTLLILISLTDDLSHIIGINF